MNIDVAVRLEKITKKYGGTAVLKELTAGLPAGRFIILFGRNGSGKSTLLRSIVGFENLDAGEIFVLGSSLDREDIHRSRKIAFISEMIEYRSRVRLWQLATDTSTLYPDWQQDIFERFFGIFKLPHDGYFVSLSRGQRVQYLFSILAATRPQLYLLDEVTAVLDAHARFQVMDYLKTEVANGATVIMATNIATETQNFGDYVVYLDGGKIAFESDVTELQKRFIKYRIDRDQLKTLPQRLSLHPVGLNTDGSMNYLAPAPEISELSACIDRRAITIEDLFVYYTGPEVKI